MSTSKPLFLSFNTTTTTTTREHCACTVHPVVFFSVLDHFSRRNTSQNRVIGTLLGSYDRNTSTYHISSSYPVPHNESSEGVAVDQEFQNSMLELHKRLTAGVDIIGWYCSGRKIDENAMFLHDYFWNETKNPPILLTVDTNLTQPELAIDAYVSSSLTFGEKQLAANFYPVRTTIISQETERIAIEALDAVKNEDQPTQDLIHSCSLEENMLKLLNSIEEVLEYIEKIQSGKIPTNSLVGRELLDAVNLLPTTGPEELERAFSERLQDVLMVVYLANLSRQQIALSERLRMSLP